jgi:RNA polymerase sigma-70 factor (ECF subfamily)
MTLARASALPDAPTLSAAEAARVGHAISTHAATVFRVVRRHGVPSRLAEDACQRVFLVFFRRFADVQVGKEGAFLCATAVRVASEMRRLSSTRHEALVDVLPEPFAAEDPEKALAEAETIAWLDRALSAVDDDARAVFVLYELEEISATEIAEQLQLPIGTVHTRLRRARLALRDAYAALQENAR